MKSSTLTESIATFHAGKTLVYIACAGAGAGCQNILSRVPGASNTILECLFPYSNEALADFLGERPGKSASLQTAINMATRAWLRGRDLARKRGADPDRVVGLGLTAVVATNRALRGEHRVFIARRSSAGLFSLQAFFGKNAQGLSVLGRERECDLCDIFAVNMLLDHAGIAQVSFPTAALKSDDILDREGEGTLRIREYVSPESPKEAAGNNVVVMPDGQKVPVATLSPSQYVLFPGSFNPLHSGHEQIAGEVTQSTGKTVVYTINLDHPVKGSLTDEESECRVKQFEWRAPVLITRGLPLFLDKAEAFPGFSFIHERWVKA